MKVTLNKRNTAWLFTVFNSWSFPFSSILRGSFCIYQMVPLMPNSAFSGLIYQRLPRHNSGVISGGEEWRVLAGAV